MKKTFSARRFARRSSETGVAPRDPLAGGPGMFLTLAAEGAEAETNQRSLPRKALITWFALVVLLFVPMTWAATALAADSDQPAGVLVKSSDDDDEDDDKDDDDTGNNDTGTGRETAAANTDQPGLETGATTAGETDGGDGTGQTEADQTTGRETNAANTDRAAVTEGASTRGETDPGDNTGKTEVR